MMRVWLVVDGRVQIIFMSSVSCECGRCGLCNLQLLHQRELQHREEQLECILHVGATVGRLYRKKNPTSSAQPHTIYIVLPTSRYRLVTLALVPSTSCHEREKERR